VHGGAEKYVAEDFSQIFLDFNLTTVKKVSEKVLFVTSLEMDNQGMLETIHIDKKGFFLFDMSSQPAAPLVSGMPLFLDSASGIQKEPKLMPLVLTVPSCRGHYYSLQ
jgi:hypothetical protein